MHPRGPVLDHPAAPDLLRWSSSGCPVDCGRPWTLTEIEAAIARGAHPSARAPAAAAACRAEALARVADGCCRVVNWHTIRNSPPANLKVSPIAAIPHKSRAYRMILDLSFELRLPTHTVPAVNATSDKTLAPQHAMYELGRVVPRLIHAMATTDTTLPLWFTKLDLKDGYWRMVVNPTDAWNFAYVLPTTTPSDPVQLVIPDSLQMGWSESPPFFCAATETARDVAAKTLLANLPLPPHPLEHVIMDTAWPPAPPAPPPTSHTWLEVYIDDFIAMAQSPNPAHFRQVARHLLHAIDNTFPGPDISGSSMGPAISEKKLLAEGKWHTTKEVLGWEFDGTHRTISLPPTKRDRLRDTARGLLTTPKFRLKTFEQLHGKLQFLSVSLPCGKALLGPGDRILSQANARQAHHITCTPFVAAYLTDWLELITIAAARPTHAKELILHPPSYLGYVDASRWGVGGVWFAGAETLEPCVWFLQWPRDITLALCSRDNPTGPITICDLELAGIFLHFLALADYLRRYNRSLRHKSVSMWCDNLAAVHWTDRFRTAQSTRAGRILRAFATQLRHHEAALLDISHIPGDHNCMADFASRPHSTHPRRFLASFTTAFPPPQHGSWTLYHQSASTASKLFSELRMTPSTLASWQRLRKRGGAFGTIGPNGWTLTSLTSAHTSRPQSPPKSLSWQPTPTMFGLGPSHTPKLARFVPRPSSFRSAPSPRPSNWQANKARWDRRKVPTPKPFNNFSPATPAPTRQPTPG